MSADEQTTHYDRADSPDQLAEPAAIQSPAKTADSAAPTKAVESSSSRWWILGLFLAHMVAVLPLIPVVEQGETPWVVLFVGLFFSQTSLLGFWAALGTNLLWQRVTGLVLGTAYLAFVLQFTFADVELIVMVTLSVLFVAGPLCAVRFWRGSLQHIGQVDCTGRQEALQFSIRNLMALTVAVACAVTAVKYVAPMVYIPWAATLAFSLAFVVVGLSGSWSMLGTRHLAVRAIAAMGLCVAAGWALGEFLGGIDAICIAMTTVQGGLFIGSLWIVRRAGYRLLRHDFSAGQESSSTMTVSESSKPA